MLAVLMLHYIRVNCNSLCANNTMTAVTIAIMTIATVLLWELPNEHHYFITINA